MIVIHFIAIFVFTEWLCVCMTCHGFCTNHVLFVCDISWFCTNCVLVCVWHVMLCYMCLVNCVMVIISHKCYKNKTDCRGLEVHTASWQWTLLSDFKYFCCFAVSNLTNYHLIIIYKSNKVIYRHIWTTNINNIVYYT